MNDTLWPGLNTSTLHDLSQQLLNSSIKTGLGVNEKGLWSPVTLLFNTTSDHSFPALIQELAQVAFRTSTKNASATLRMASHPLPLTKNEALHVQSVLTGLAALFTLIPLSYCAASFAVFVIQERVVKAKLLQVHSNPPSHLGYNLLHGGTTRRVAFGVKAKMVHFGIKNEERKRKLPKFM